MQWSLSRSQRELAAARTLLEAGFAAQATSRAYYAAFYAAEACLLTLGETRSKHAAVIAAFAQYFVKAGAFGPEMAHILRSLFDRRLQADYGGPDIPAPDASAALADAEHFVSAVAGWVEAHPAP